MKDKNKIFCHLDALRFISEDMFCKEAGKSTVISITSGIEKEMMIFIGIDVLKNCFEVQIYKDKPTDKYMPHLLDNVKGYNENDEYALFIFDTFYFAKEFVDMLSIRHKEYKKRPIRKYK